MVNCVIDALDGPGFEGAGGAVTQAAFGRGAVITARHLPRSADFRRNDRDAQPTSTGSPGWR